MTRVCSALLVALMLGGRQQGADILVNAQLARYQGFVRQMANDSIAALYAPNGQLMNPGGNRTPLTGPAAIAAFLKTFDAYKVIAYDITADTTRVLGDSALQAGHWTQRVRVPAGDTVNVKGRFHAVWVKTPGGWRIRRLGTSPG